MNPLATELLTYQSAAARYEEQHREAEYALEKRAASMDLEGVRWV